MSNPFLLMACAGWVEERDELLAKIGELESAIAQARELLDEEDPDIGNIEAVLRSVQLIDGDARPESGADDA